jgi:hypothetical protein
LPGWIGAFRSLEDVYKNLAEIFVSGGIEGTAEVAAR